MEVTSAMEFFPSIFAVGRDRVRSHFIQFAILCVCFSAAR